MKEELKRLISGSYGSVDGLFAGHPLDAERARESLITAAMAHVALMSLFACISI